MQREVINCACDCGLGYFCRERDAFTTAVFRDCVLPEENSRNVSWRADPPGVLKKKKTGTLERERSSVGMQGGQSLGGLANGMGHMRLGHASHGMEAQDNDTDELTRLLLGQDAEPQRGQQLEQQHTQMHANRHVLNDSFPFAGPFSSAGGQGAPTLNQHGGGNLSSDPMGDFRQGGPLGGGYNAAPIGGGRLFERAGAANPAYTKQAPRVQSTVPKQPMAQAATASIRGLVALGFDETSAREALYLAQHDFNKAYEYLSSQGEMQPV